MDTSNSLAPLFSSSKTGGKDEWATPQALFEAIQKANFPEGDKFELDPCADATNAKCPKFYTEQDNGLSQPWAAHKRIFINPPYGHIKEWSVKAIEEAALLKAQDGHCAIVMLIPARTDTVWFQNLAKNANTIVFLKGRVKFGDSKNSAPFPSAVVIMTNLKVPDEVEVFFEDWRD